MSLLSTPLGVNGGVETGVTGMPSEIIDRYDGFNSKDSSRVISSYPIVTILEPVLNESC